jgi:hypothetical protein
MGLGLCTLAARVTALGGMYGVSERADGKAGNTFWFTIPYFPMNPRKSYYSANLVQPVQAAIAAVREDQMTSQPLVVGRSPRGEREVSKRV